MISIFSAVTLFTAACERALPPEPADIVLRNGGIYTVDAARSWAEAAAIRDGVVVAVGANSDVEQHIGAETRVVDLASRMAMPGIHDSHIHPLEGGYEQVYCNLWDYSDSVADVVRALRECAAENDDDWFNAVGLDLGLFGLAGPDKSLLDGIAPDKYIFVDGSDGHAALINDAVLELVGFDADTPDPIGGVIERREGSREPNGTVRETARDLIDKLRPPRELETSVDAMAGALKTMNAFGITSVYDVWIGELEMQVYEALDQSGDLSVRVLGAITDEGVFGKHTGAELERVIRERGQYESERVSYNSIKLFVDGVFEGETGAVLEPYNSADHHGVLNHSPSELRDRVARYYDRGLQLHFHTMGDGAARAALDALAYARERGDPAHKQMRHALSHLGLIDPAEFSRFRELNAAAAFTAIWAYPSQWTVNLEIPTLGQARVDRMYPIRSVHEAGGIVVGASDWNYGELNPLLSIETAVTRQDPFGPSELTASTQEAVSLATMIDAYTINGAWLAHQDDRLGSIEAGKLADIVVFDRNLFDIQLDQISEAVVDLTIFDGRIVYDRSDTDNE
ncbi:MAG: amidohydrolase [Gammaproteobacteria bacterium]|nr:amidohydrolase [Gammaproteobacteria bacterium]